MRAISPMLVFVVLYLVTSIILGDFYKVPLTLAFLLSSIYALVAASSGTMNQRVESFCKGAGSKNIMLMICIFILAGAFASSAKQMGAIDATVDAAINLLPPQMLLAGLFLAACFISISVGTSVGTIVALVPIAVGMAHQTGMIVPMVVGTVVGGAFFGDNLSFISDTTIVATKTQGCAMSDKFRVNIHIVLPAAIVIFALYLILGNTSHIITVETDVQWIKILPYLLVLVMAGMGMNVMTVLVMGIAMTGLIGILDHSYDIWGWLDTMNQGIMGMSELIVVTMLAAGMLEIVRKEGGLEFMIRFITRHVNGKRAAEMCIATLVAVVDMCTANNTVAILTVGDISRQLADRYNIDKRRSASILDTFSCAMQGLIPYGAQLLMAGGLAMINPVEIVPYAFYPMALIFVAVLAIIFRYPRKFA